MNAGDARKPAANAPDTLEESTVEFASRLKFLRINETDAQRLRQLLPSYRAWAADFVAAFYDHLFSYPGSAKFLQNPEVVARLKIAQAAHFESLLAADWNAGYVVDRQQVGQVHADTGIAPDLFLGAFNEYAQFLLQRVGLDERGDIESRLETLSSVLKVIFLDIGLSLDAYFTQSTQSLRHALDMLWKANAELRQFAQFASHDMKTPLATVANLCDEALDEFGHQMPAEAKRLIAAARERTFRMSSMIDELLATSTALDHRDTVEAFPSLLALDEAVDRLQPAMVEKGIHLTMPETMPVVVGDKARLREAFFNLLSNAVKFIDRPDGTIQVSCAANPAEHVFCVADNGPGIPRDELERIFAPFRRLPSAKSTPGSGLGLYFTKTLIERSGGRVWAESELSRGSRFYIALPRETA